MPLYEVRRTDTVQPGEFVNALVIAGGTAQARAAVQHLEGVTKRNVEAVKVDTNGRNGVRLLSIYNDEREPVTSDWSY
jgi:hypothetical protein